MITSGIVGREGETAAVRRRVADGPVHQHVAVLPVGARTTLVADAVQAPDAVERIAHLRANGPRHAGEGPRGIGASVEAEAGAQKMEGTQKGHLVGVKAEPEVRVRTCPAETVGAKDEI